jgi:energy-coupling factor transporter ATP-binding protein EcfA2
MEVAQVFTPGAPIDQLALFAGRFEQVKDVLSAVAQRGQHVILFGERGVGKTSLANVLQDISEDREQNGLQFFKINCNTTDNFYSLWRKVYRELGGMAPEEPPDTPEDIRFALDSLGLPVAIILDELDRFEDDEGLSLLADTIKSLSDHSVPATLVLVGVADSIDQLIGEHASVERALVQVRMPRMSEQELAEIIDKGCERIGMSVERPARARIARLSEGLPHYTHALSLHAAQRAVIDERAELNWEDVSAATDLAVQKAEHSIQTAYRLATQSPQKGNLFPQVLLACALAPKDEHGYFPASAVREPMSAIMKKKYEIPAFARHLSAFTTELRGAVLQKSGTEYRYFYRFSNPLLQPYVVMDGLAKGLITDGLVREVQKIARSDQAESDDIHETEDPDDLP